MNFIHEESQTLRAETPDTVRQSQTTQTSTSRKPQDEPENLSAFVNIPRADLEHALSEMDPSHVYSICRSLYLDVSSAIDSIRFFAESLDDHRYLLLLRLLTPVDSGGVGSRSGTVGTFSRSMIPKFDLGFSFRSDFDSSLVAGPVVVGSNPYSESFSVKIAKKAHQRVIIQFVRDSGPCFPPSLKLWIGDRAIATGESLRKRKYIDVTEVVAGSRRVLIEIQVHIEQEWYCFVIRVVDKPTFDELLSAVLTRKAESQTRESVICPISRKVMKVPVRSLKCRHDQCYDFKALIKSGFPGDVLICPICLEPILFDDLAVDFDQMQALAQMRVTKEYASFRHRAGARVRVVDTGV